MLISPATGFLKPKQICTLSKPNISKTLSFGAAASAWRLMDLMLFGLEFDELVDLKKGVTMGTFLCAATVRALICVLKHM